MQMIDESSVGILRELGQLLAIRHEEQRQQRANDARATEHHGRHELSGTVGDTEPHDSQGKRNGSIGAIDHEHPRVCGNAPVDAGETRGHEQERRDDEHIGQHADARARGVRGARALLGGLLLACGVL